MIVRDLGMIGYEEAFQLQERLVAELLAGGAETLLLLEHHPVYTIGAGGKISNLLKPDLKAVRVNRGGDVTYHGPGQLVGYPILDLGRRGRDLHRYLRFIEEFLIGLNMSLGVDSFTLTGKTGVWTAKGKLASIGVGVRRWVSMHGFALNVSPDTAAFRLINPCGLKACPITTLAQERADQPSLEEVKELVKIRFEPLLERHLPRS